VAGQHENAGADNAADAECNQIERRQRSLEVMPLALSGLRIRGLGFEVAE
jgi:hypothetical protein